MHSHRAKTTTERCFSGPVVRDHQNPMAHGNIVEIATCSCGAIRRTNINGRHVERGPWIDADYGFSPARYARELGWDFSHVAATASQGVGEWDRANIRDQAAVTALLRWCRDRVAEAQEGR